MLRWPGTLLTLFIVTRLVAQTSPRLDPDVQPAQFVTGMATAVVDPPVPVVRLQVRTPATVAPGKEIPYKFIISNSSAGDAYKVTLRCPVPAAILEVTKTEPKPDRTEQKKDYPKGELVWVIGTLKAGGRQEIEVAFKPSPDVKEVSSAAYITFEYGQVVVTKIDKPKLTVDKQAPEKIAQGERFPIRVVVSNTGKVPIKGIELVEDISPTFQFVSGGSEGERTAKPTQRIFKLGTLPPGQRQVIEYFVKTDKAAELLSQSIVRSPDVMGQEEATSTTKVLTSSFTLELTGPPTSNASDPAKYEIKVTNTGTLPLTDLRVTAVLPKDCTLTRVTDGARRYRDGIEWMIPDRQEGPLRPGQAFTLRFELKANSSGTQTIRTTVEGPREPPQSREVKTSFEGTSLLSWEATATPVQLATSRNGTITIKVQNKGTEPAKAVKLRVELPPEVQLVEVTPKYRQDGIEIAFDPLNLPAKGQEIYTVTYRAVKSGRTNFKLKLYAEGYENDPLRKEQEILITP